MQRGRMRNAESALPDKFEIDRILEKISILTEDSGVRLLMFDPKSEQISDTAFKYVELPIALKLRGNYKTVLTFLDTLVHLELLVHLRNISITPEMRAKRTCILEKYRCLNLEGRSVAKKHSS